MAEILENAPEKLSKSSQETSSGEEPPSGSADAQSQMHPPVNRFLMIRNFLSKSAPSTRTPQPFNNFSTYRIELLKEWYKGKVDRIPPPPLVGDLLQADIDESLGEGTSMCIDRSCVYISEEGDVGYLAGPNPFDRFTSTKTSEMPTQYIFRLGKSLKSVDCIGAWSMSSLTLPAIERHEPVFDKLTDTLKASGESSVRCTPIVYRSFSETAKKRLLEASLKPSRRTLGSFDAFREDGVTIVPELQDENEKEEDVREVAGLSSQPEFPKEGEQKEEANREREIEEVAQPKNESLDEPLRLTTPRYRTEQINHDIPPAPMPPPVDPSVFEGFDPILPPEPDTPSDDLKAPGLGSMDPPAPNDPGETDRPTPHDAAPPSTSTFEKDEVAIRENQSTKLSIGVQTDQGETEVDGSSAQNTGQELAAPEGVSQTAPGSAGANHTPSTPPSAASAAVSDPEANQLQHSAGDGIQPRLASETELWTLICTLASLLVLQIIAVLTTRTLPEPLHEVPINIQNDVAAAAPARTQTPELGETIPDTGSPGRQERRTTDPDASSPALVPFTPTHIQRPTEEGSDSNAIAQPPQQVPRIESGTSQVEAQTPNSAATPVPGAGLDSEAAEVQESTQPTSTSINPSTPAGLRRSRPQTTPPSAESQRRPPKRIREEISGELAGVEGDIQPPGPLSSPVFGNANAEADGSGQSQMTQADGDMPDIPPAQPPNSGWASIEHYPSQEAPDTTNQEGLDQADPLPTALASIEQMTPDNQPAAPERIPSSDSDHDTSMESTSAPDPDSKAKGKNVPTRSISISSPPRDKSTSPPEMEWNSEALPTLDPTSNLERCPNPISSPEMDVDPESPGPSLAGVAGSSTGVQSSAAGVKGLKTTGRQIKRLRLLLGQPQPKSTPSQIDVPMAVDEVGTSLHSHGSGFPGYLPPPQPAAAGPTISHDDHNTYTTTGEICPSPIQIDPIHDTPVVNAQADGHESAAEASEESLSGRDSPVPNEAEGNIIPTEQPADEADELDSDDEPLDPPRGSSPADRGESQENNADHHAATADHETESTDDGSDFSDAVHEAKASKYSTSNASAAADIEKELEDNLDSESQPQAPVERTGPRVSASTTAFGLPGLVGPRAGRSTSPTARLDSLSSAFNSHTISGSRNVGGFAEVSPAGGEPTHDEESEDI